VIPTPRTGGGGLSPAAPRACPRPQSSSTPPQDGIPSAARAIRDGGVDGSLWTVRCVRIQPASWRWAGSAASRCCLHPPRS
jgi:hypothetical protein